MEQARAPDGYEEEVIYEENADTPTSLPDCKKNPGHEGFIPVKTFSKANLPEKYKDDDIVNFILTIASLTVCLKVSFVSQGRPDTYPDGKPYLHANHKGSDKITRIGSGFIKSVYKDDHGGWSILIMTAHCVIFNNSEVRKTKCLLDFDDGNAIFTTLQGREVRDITDLKQDYIEFICHTDDDELASRLQKNLTHQTELSTKIKDKYNIRKPSKTHPLTVVVSHPHGTFKHISVGEWKDKEDYRYNSKFTSYAYDTPTCNGSSGAPVWIFGTGDNVHLFSHAHIKTREGLNFSGVGHDDLAEKQKESPTSSFKLEPAVAESSTNTVSLSTECSSSTNSTSDREVPRDPVLCVEVIGDLIGKDEFIAKYGRKLPFLDLKNFETDELPTDCENNHHEKFIPSIEFMSEPEKHLPPCYQTEDVKTLIQNMSRLVVRIYVEPLSNGRTGKYVVKGKHLLGSGFVISLLNNKKVLVATAAHIIFDDEEAKNSTAEFFGIAEGGDKKMKGLRMRERSFHFDCCIVEFELDDDSLGSELNKILNKVRERKTDQVNVPKQETGMVCIISHPHGKEQRVSLGECTGKKETTDSCCVISCYEYKTHTCEGSSGGLVLPLNGRPVNFGQQFFYSNFHVHSRKKEVHHDVSWSGIIQEPTFWFKYSREQLMDDQGLYPAEDEEICFEVLYLHEEKQHECFKDSDSFSMEKFKTQGEFSLADLPEKYKNDNLCFFIKQLTLISVKVEIQCNSSERPDPYPGIKSCSIELPRLGSGFLAFLRQNHFYSDDYPSQETCYGFAYIMTTNYLVFDSEEAASATFHFPLKSKTTDSTNLSLTGIGVVDSNIDADYSVVVCGIKDKAVYEQLLAIHTYLHNLEKKVNLEKLEVDKEDLAVIISFPYGLGPYISVGHRKEQEKFEEDKDFIQVQYSYTTPVCPGSNGALVYMPHQNVLTIRDRFIPPPVHIGATDTKGVNKSGLGFESWETASFQDSTSLWDRRSKKIIRKDEDTNHLSADLLTPEELRPEKTLSPPETRTIGKEPDISQSNHRDTNCNSTTPAIKLNEKITEEATPS